MRVSCSLDGSLTRDPIPRYRATRDPALFFISLIAGHSHATHWASAFEKITPSRLHAPTSPADVHCLTCVGFLLSDSFGERGSLLEVPLNDAVQDCLHFSDYADVIAEQILKPGTWPVGVGVLAQWGAGKVCTLVIPSEKYFVPFHPHSPHRAITFPLIRPIAVSP